MTPIQITIKTINQAYIITVKIKKNTPPDSVLLDTELVPYIHRLINETTINTITPSKSTMLDTSSETKTQKKIFSFFSPDTVATRSDHVKKHLRNPYCNHD